MTLLTSIDEDTLSSLGFATTPGKLVSRLARLADSAGCEGVVCSSREVTVVHQVSDRLLKVVPGLRPDGAQVTTNVEPQPPPRRSPGERTGWSSGGRSSPLPTRSLPLFRSPPLAATLRPDPPHAAGGDGGTGSAASS